MNYHLLHHVALWHAIYQKCYVIECGAATLIKFVEQAGQLSQDESRKLRGLCRREDRELLIVARAYRESGYLEIFGGMIRQQKF